MASEHDWRYVAPFAMKETDYITAICRDCGIKARRLPNTDTWEIIENKPTYNELEQRLAQARATEAGWEETHRKGMADLRALVLREHQQLMEAREEHEQAIEAMRVELHRLRQVGLSLESDWRQARTLMEEYVASCEEGSPGDVYKATRAFLADHPKEHA